jgi:hypothetical protein
MQTEDPKDKRYENKYWELALMLCYFLIPFVGLQRPLRHYLEANELQFGYVLLLLFIGGNIMTSFIFILNDKNLKTKSLWTVGLLLIVVIVNVIV